MQVRSLPGELRGSCRFESGQRAVLTASSGVIGNTPPPNPGSSNGKTAGSGSAYVGSSPAPGAILKEVDLPRGVKFATEAERKAARRISVLAAQKRWREANRDRVAAANKAWREANREKVAADARAWAKANPERRRELSNKGGAVWAARNPEKKKAKNAAWWQSNPQARIEASQRRRARIRGTDPDFTAEQWFELLDEFDHACAYCQTRGGSLEREHLTPLARGGRHTKSNIVPSCRSCNAKKGKKTMLEFLTLAA